MVKLLHTRNFKHPLLAFFYFYLKGQSFVIPFQYEALALQIKVKSNKKRQQWMFEVFFFFFFKRKEKKKLQTSSVGVFCLILLLFEGPKLRNSISGYFRG